MSRDKRLDTLDALVESKDIQSYEWECPIGDSEGRATIVFPSGRKLVVSGDSLGSGPFFELHEPR